MAKVFTAEEGKLIPCVSITVTGNAPDTGRLTAQMPSH